MISLPRLAVRRPVAFSMLFLAVILLGGISFGRLPIDLLPDVSYPRLIVFTTLPERGPAEIERLITERIESSIAQVAGIERVTSVSRDGASLVSLRFDWGTNMDFAMLNVRERLDNIRGSLPSDASRPLILRVDPESEPIMVLSVAGGDLWELKELAENVFRRRLEQLDGIAQASVTKGFDREIVVEVDPNLLEVYGLTLSQVAGALDRANQAGQSGEILQGRTRFPLRTIGEFRQVPEMEEVVITQGTGGGTPLRIRDVAKTHDTFADRQAIARYNGNEAVGLLIFKEPGANTVQVAAMVQEVVGLLRNEFPEVSIDVASSQAGFISDSIDSVVSALILGGFLAFLVLFLFLREPRYPIAIAIAIPISIIGTFTLMDAFGVSLNIMSLGGLALGVGMLVDNSIIVLENIFRHRENGVPAMEAAARGGEEVGGAITASTLTTIAVFAPIIYVEGVAGELFRDLSLAVAFSLLFSLVVALTILPTMAARFRMGARPETRGPGSLTPGPRPAGFFRIAWWGLQTLGRLPFWLFRVVKGVAIELFHFWWGGLGRFLSKIFSPLLRAFDRVYDIFAARYHTLLERALDRRGVVLVISLVLLGGALFAGSTLNRDLLPRVDQGAFNIEFALPEGTALFRTDEVSKAVEEILVSDPDVEAVFGTAGRDIRRLARGDETTGLHTAHFQVRLVEGAASDPVIERLRPRIEAVVEEGDLAILTGQATALGQILGGTDADIAIRIRGEDIGAAFDYAELVIAGLQNSDRVTNARTASERGQSQYDVQILREEAARYGIQAASVANAVGEAMQGIRTSNEFVAFDRKIPIVVRYPDRLRYDVGTLERLQVSGIPLSELVRIGFGSAPAEIRREDQGRVVTVLADVRRGGLDQAIAEVEEVLAALPPPTLHRIEVGGENEEMRRSFRDLAFAFGLAFILVYMILAAQFESFVHPATILAAVPLALIGALLALLVTGHGLNTMSLIGIVILIGIAVNDAIVKVTFIVQARERGASTRDAIIKAGRVRLRPILMTTITTVLGLTPMALGIGRGADLRAPLAVAVIGGLIVATFLTLIVIPVLYSLVEDLRLSIVGEKEAKG